MMPFGDKSKRHHIGQYQKGSRKKATPLSDPVNNEDGTLVEVDHNYCEKHQVITCNLEPGVRAGKYKLTCDEDFSTKEHVMTCTMEPGNRSISRESSLICETEVYKKQVIVCKMDLGTRSRECNVTKQKISKPTVIVCKMEPGTGSGEYNLGWEQEVSTVEEQENHIYTEMDTDTYKQTEPRVLSIRKANEFEGEHNFHVAMLLNFEKESAIRHLYRERNWECFMKVLSDEEITMLYNRSDSVTESIDTAAMPHCPATQQMQTSSEPVQASTETNHILTNHIPIKTELQSLATEQMTEAVEQRQKIVTSEEVTEKLIQINETTFELVPIKVEVNDWDEYKVKSADEWSINSNGKYMSNDSMAVSTFKNNIFKDKNRNKNEEMFETNSEIGLSKHSQNTDLFKNKNDIHIVDNNSAIVIPECSNYIQNAENNGGVVMPTGNSSIEIVMSENINDVEMTKSNGSIHKSRNIDEVGVAEDSNSTGAAVNHCDLKDEQQEKKSMSILEQATINCEKNSDVNLNHLLEVNQEQVDDADSESSDVIDNGEEKAVLMEIGNPDDSVFTPFLYNHNFELKRKGKSLNSIASLTYMKTNSSEKQLTKPILKPSEQISTTSQIIMMNDQYYVLQGGTYIPYGGSVQTQTQSTKGVQEATKHIPPAVSKCVCSKPAEHNSLGITPACQNNRNVTETCSVITESINKDMSTLENCIPQNMVSRKGQYFVLRDGKYVPQIVMQESSKQSQNHITTRDSLRKRKKTNLEMQHLPNTELGSNNTAKRPTFILYPTSFYDEESKQVKIFGKFASLQEHDLVKLEHRMMKRESVEQLMKRESTERLIKPTSTEQLVKPKSLERLVKPKSSERLVKPSSPKRLVKPKSTDRLVKQSSPKRLVKPKSTLLLVKPKSTVLLVKPKLSEWLVKPKSKELLVKPNSTRQLAKPKPTEKFVVPKSTDMLIEPKSTDRLIEPISTERLIEPNSTERLIEPNSTERFVTLNSKECFIEPKSEKLNQSDLNPQNSTIETPITQPMSRHSQLHTILYGKAHQTGVWGKSKFSKHNSTESKFSCASKQARQASEKKKRQQIKPHQCEVCGAKFHFRTQLVHHRKHTRHGLTRNGPTLLPYQCEICGKIMESHLHVWRHKKTHNQRNVKCELCSSVFKSDIIYKEHLYTSHVIEPQQCQICFKILRNRKLLSKHMHYHRQNFWCSICQRALKRDVRCHMKTKSHLINSMHLPTVIVGYTVMFLHDTVQADCTDHGSRNETDNIPDKLDSNNDKANNSTNKMHSSIRNIYGKFDNETHITSEMLRTGPAKQDSGTSSADRAFNSNSDMKRLENHATPTGHCFVCNAEFGGDIVLLMKHQLSEHPDMVKKYISYSCQTCGQSYTHTYDLRKHKKETGHVTVGTRSGAGLSHNSKTDKSFQCDACGRVLSCKNALEVHNANIHNIYNRLYPCDQCSETFKHKSYLVIHKSYHHTEDPKTCDVCFKIFTNRMCLKRHQRHHRKSHSCKVCNKSFPFPFNLKEHYLTQAHIRRAAEHGVEIAASDTVETATSHAVETAASASSDM